MTDSILLISSVKDGKVHSLDFALDEQQIRTLAIIAKTKGQRIECMKLYRTPMHIEPKAKDNEKKRDINEISRMHVKWVEKGIIAESASHIAEYTGIHLSTIILSLKLGRSIKGRTFIFTSEPLNIEPKQLKQYTRRTSWPGAFKVLCQETGIIYDSVRDASRDTKIIMQQIYNSIRSGKPRNGLTFVKIE